MSKNLNKADLCWAWEKLTYLKTIVAIALCCVFAHSTLTLAFLVGAFCLSLIYGQWCVRRGIFPSGRRLVTKEER